MFVLFIIVFLLTGCMSSSTEPGSTPPSAEVRPDEAPASWSGQVQSAIANSEYAPVADGDGFRATNRSQDFQVVFGDEGVTLSARNGSRGEVALRLQAWGREGAVVLVNASRPEEGACRADGSMDNSGDCLRRVEYTRPGLTEWWENRSDGLEHGFKVTDPPDRDGDEPLVFDLALTGAMAEAEADGTVALLLADEGADLRYSGLAAWDSLGRELPAWMEETEEGLLLVVDDAGAVGKITVDPLLTTVAWMAESDQADANFGWSVSSAGDVNGDGFGDVIVGAPLFDNGQINEGRMYLYLGSPTGIAATASYIYERDNTNGKFGYSVSSAGDVNGDRYSDVVVGEFGLSQAYLYTGSSSGLSTTGSRIDVAAVSTFGYSVSSAGDVNGDGFGDVIVGAPDYSNGEYQEGGAFLYAGSATGLSATALWSTESDQANAELGRSASSAGDVNGDGYGDVVVGAYNYCNGQDSEGRAWLFLGSATGLSTTAAWTAEPDQADAQYGFCAATAGDVNGDGYSDVIVGGYGYSSSGDDEGGAWLYLGTASGLSNSAAWMGASERGDSLYGWSLSTAGDVNGDGFSDVVVGAFHDAYDATYQGRAYLYLGSEDGLSSEASWIAGSLEEDAGFGYSVSSAGDVDGDGFSDVLVGAEHYDNGEADEGGAWLYMGSGSLFAPVPSWTAESDQAGTEYGHAMASAGDVNGDGFADVLVGAARYSNDQTEEGRAFLYMGSGSGVSPSPTWTGESGQDSAFFGNAVASAGDVNSDGYADIVIGSMYYSNDQPYEGRAYLYLGSATGLSFTNAWTAESNQPNAAFGHSVSSAGDVNGDGFDDVIVGAPDYDNVQGNVGRAFLFLGSVSGLSPTASSFVESDLGNSHFGSSTASGDMNGDGYSDVLVGADAYANGQPNEGRAYLFLGSATGLSTTASWIVESDQAYSSLGFAVSAAGDVNGDGYADVAVGARNYTAGQASEGRAFVYLGSSSGLAISPSWIAESDQVQAYFGHAVTSAGDINGDGFGDLAVGAYAHDNGQADEGRVYIYLGTTSGLSSTASLTIEPDLASQYFGYSVASSGDVNGDGYCDLLVGAHGWDNGQTDEGRAFLYLGNGADGTGPGLALTGQARRPGLSTPISPGLKSPSTNTFDVSLASARGPWGRSRVKVQVETKPLGTPFNGTGLVTQPSYTSSGLTGASITQSLTGLVPATGYHWRARVLVSPAEGQKQGWGHWIYGGLSGNAVGSHVFTGSQTYTLYADRDGDGYGDATASIISHTATLAGYVSVSSDCNDSLATVNPGAAEVCDASNVDEDCDGFADDADPGTTGKTSWYRDVDGDGYGTSALTTQACDPPTGYAATSTDCNDGSATVNPGATEICDAANIDEDCDGIADDTDPSVSSATKTTWYRDADGDGYGVSTSTTSACDLPAGYSSTSTDCNDGSSVINPGATEVCDTSNVDEDCDGLADDADVGGAAGRTAWYRDVDGDGYGTPTATSQACDLPTGYSGRSTDCDDTSALINPGATEICDSANTDEDCDGLADDADPNVSASSMATWYQDADGDGYGTLTSTTSACDLPAGYATTITDCNDASAAIHPGATEVCDPSNVDEDCDGFADDADIRGATGRSTWYRDSDGDGYGTPYTTITACDPPTGYAATGTDCNDASAAIHPGASEVCDTSNVDEDCDGLADDADPGGATGRSTWFRDADADGYGTSTSTVSACDLPTGYAVNSADCDDTRANVNPSAAEACDPSNIDENCNGLADDASASGQTRWYWDTDLDGFGDPSTFSIACDALVGTVASATDCDDRRSDVHPGATEVCDSANTDENCDGQADDASAAGQTLWYRDADVDGFGDPAQSTLACDPPAGTVADDTDCNDADPAFNPGAKEDCADPNDYNCDGSTQYADNDNDGSPACLDCDDARPDVNPGATEICDSANTDEDCDGLADDDEANATGLTPWYRDADGDGFGDPTDSVDACDPPVGMVADATDCNDSDSAYHPGATESCTDPRDLNCDGSVGGVDADLDGFYACEECDDTRADVNPGAAEVCDDADMDEDCDGLANDADPSVTEATIWYLDADGDGFGRSDATLESCEQPSNYVADATDCDDLSPTTWPGAEEIPGDGIDQDCDGSDAPLMDTGETADTSGPDDTDDTSHSDDTGSTKEAKKGCAGCAGTGPNGFWALGLAGILLLAGRRRKKASHRICAP